MLSFFFEMAGLAIDVGTFNTCACVISNGQTTMVRDQGDPLIPSVIRFNDNGSIQCIGKNAYKDYWNAKNVVRCFKRIIGYVMNSRVMHDYMKNCAISVPKKRFFPFFQIGIDTILNPLQGQKKTFLTTTLTTIY